MRRARGRVIDRPAQSELFPLNVGGFRLIQDKATDWAAVMRAQVEGEKAKGTAASMQRALRLATTPIRTCRNCGGQSADVFCGETCRREHARDNAGVMV